MGFTDYEKSCLRKMEREVHYLVEEELDPKFYDFLREENLLRHVTDRIIIPRGRKKKAENIILQFYVDNNFNLAEKISELEDILSPSFQILIDCSFLLQKGLDDGKIFISSYLN